MLLIPSLATYTYGFDVRQKKMQDDMLDFDYSVINMIAPFTYFYLISIGLAPLSTYFEMDAEMIKEGMDNIGTYDSFYKIAKGIIGVELYLDIPSHNLINIEVTGIPSSIVGLYTNNTDMYVNPVNNAYVGEIPNSSSINTGVELALHNYLQNQLSAGDILDKIEIEVTS